MNKLKIILLAICLVLYPTMSAYSTDNSDKAHSRVDLNIILNSINKNYDIPEESGVVKNMPWRNNEDFLKAKEKYKTPILMAGYCAVLNNPLPGEEYNVALAAKSINGQIIKADKIFSQNNNIGPFTKRRGYKNGSSYFDGSIVMTEGGGVCKVASVLYNLAVFSNLEIVERYNHSMPINYVPYGQDAAIAYGLKDFRFKNTTNGNILIWSKLIGNRLYMGFYGVVYTPSVTWNHEITDIIKPSVKYVKNENLKPGEMVVKISGMDGAKVKSTVTIVYKNGTIAIKKMTPSNYLPMSKLIEIN